MIVRTYGRRNRGISRTFSDSSGDAFHDSFEDSLSQENSQDQVFSIAFSSQDSSSRWSNFDSEPYGTNSSQGSLSANATRSSFDDSLNGGVNRKNKKAKIEKGEIEVFRNSQPSIPSTSTLMEAQEFGEMMEHVDEVNFALDGLRKGQPIRIRRASLISLLSISCTLQRRRLLRTHGMAKTITDAVLGLSFDDSASNLAAATLLYILTGDGQDDHLLESPDCVNFLIKLLKPIVSMAAEVKGPRIGHKLLALRMDSDASQGTTKALDSSSAAIFSKVQEILVSCKEMKSSCIDKSRTGRPELCPKWIALLTMEKACLTTISLEETSGAIRKTGGDFKEKLRELGGLDAVFEVARDCYSNMEGYAEDISLSTLDGRYENFLQSLMLLLKCLKIMENATFLSKDNQSHLLGIKRTVENRGTPKSFTEIILNVIKILSGLYLRKSSAAAINDEKFVHLLDGIYNDYKEFSEADCEANKKITLPSSNLKKWCDTKSSSPIKSFNISQSIRIATDRLDNSLTTSGTTSSTPLENTSLFKMRLISSTSGSSSVTSRSTDTGVTTLNNHHGGKINLVKIPDFTEDAELDFSEDQDPFAFDEGDFKPSKWELLSQKENKSQAKKGFVKSRDFENGCQSQQMMSKNESINGQSDNSNKISCSTSSNEEGFSLVADCLLTSIKVLMNLTNDNHVGCRQIASCGGLESMCSLIANHFPSFCSTSSTFNDLKVNTSSLELDLQNEKNLTDQELDFLVAILGLLVNLVEKDGHNRSRLAAASVSIPKLHGLEKSHSNVIPLICSIFLANQGASEGVGEEQSLPWNDEVAVLEGEKEAEKMIVEAYAALLLAFISTESKGIRDAIVDCLPGHNLAILVPVLERFVAFHLTLNMISPETHKAVTEVIESCKNS